MVSYRLRFNMLGAIRYDGNAINYRSFRLEIERQQILEDYAAGLSRYKNAYRKKDRCIDIPTFEKEKKKKNDTAK